MKPVPTRSWPRPRRAGRGAAVVLLVALVALFLRDLTTEERAILAASDLVMALAAVAFAAAWDAHTRRRVLSRRDHDSSPVPRA